MANRFTRVQPKQYVDTFTELPLQFLQGLAEKKQAGFDQSINQSKALADFLKFDVAPGDIPGYDKLVKDYNDQINNIVTSQMNTGDYVQSGRDLFQLNRKIANDSNISQLKQFRKNYEEAYKTVSSDKDFKLRDDWQKGEDLNTATSWDKTLNKFIARSIDTGYNKPDNLKDSKDSFGDIKLQKTERGWDLWDEKGIKHSYTTSQGAILKKDIEARANSALPAYSTTKSYKDHIEQALKAGLSYEDAEKFAKEKGIAIMTSHNLYQLENEDKHIHRKSLPTEGDLDFLELTKKEYPLPGPSLDVNGQGLKTSFFNKQPPKNKSNIQKIPGAFSDSKGTPYLLKPQTAEEKHLMIMSWLPKDDVGKKWKKSYIEGKLSGDVIIKKAAEDMKGTDYANNPYFIKYEEPPESSYNPYTKMDSQSKIVFENYVNHAESPDVRERVAKGEPLTETEYERIYPKFQAILEKLNKNLKVNTKVNKVDPKKVHSSLFSTSEDRIKVGNFKGQQVGVYNESDQLWDPRKKEFRSLKDILSNYNDNDYLYVTNENPSASPLRMLVTDDQKENFAKTVTVNIGKDTYIMGDKRYYHDPYAQAEAALNEASYKEGIVIPDIMVFEEDNISFDGIYKNGTYYILEKDGTSVATGKTDKEAIKNLKDKKNNK